jgi:hypothetical protein
LIHISLPTNVDSVPNGVFGICFTKSCHILRRNSPNLQETWRINKICWKKIPREEARKWVFHDAWRPWRGAKSCSTGDRPPTYYFSTGHRPGFWFLVSNYTTHNPPPPPPPGSGTGFGTDTFGHKIRCSHGICKVAYEKVLEMGSGNSSFPFCFQYFLGHNFMN